MRLAPTFAVAFSALVRNTTRSLLTILGVIIGVAAVISMVSIGEGAKKRVAQTFEGMGTATLYVRSGSTRTGGVHRGAGSQPTLTWSDLQAIRTEVSSVAYAAPQLRAAAQVVSEFDNWQTTVVGTTPEYFAVRNWRVKVGEAFSAADVSAGRKLAIVGQTVVDNLYGPNVDPIGETLRINRIPFVITGVAAEKGSSPFGSDYDDTVIIPSTTFGAKISGGLQQYIRGEILVAAIRPEATQDAEREITTLLRQRHRIRTGVENDFSVRNLSEIAEAQQESAETITALLAGVALVSLVVGGIGIMNIMLVSVTERTREIGLRMAVGAKPRHILAQFLIEAIVLSLAGGLLGIGVGLATASYMADHFTFPLLIRIDIIALAVGVSIAIGVGFGIYPARKASRLDPIEALRYE